jgi:hypothetical protein
MFADVRRAYLTPGDSPGAKYFAWACHPAIRGNTLNTYWPTRDHPGRVTLLAAALACVWLGVCWQGLMDKRLTLKRVEDCAFLGFALGRAAGGAAEFLDHQDYGTPMDMRIPVSECHSLTRPRDLPSGR